jgi:aurora kinase
MHRQGIMHRWVFLCNAFRNFDRQQSFFSCVKAAALNRSNPPQSLIRDIKPENIFLTRSGRMRLGDFGLAMDWCKEIPFSRSGTLDYMAPEVLVNPATQLQESPSVDIATLEAKGIKPFTSAVDVWAAGVLAYELVGGRPPFEVEDEVKTVTRIIYCNSITFPEGFSPMLMDFVRHALIKDPNMRPDARTLLSHPW